VIRLLLLLVLALPAYAQDHRGGTLRLLARAAAGTLDPQVNYTAQYWQLYCFTHDGLVAFRKTPGLAGLELVPDLADALPEDEGGLAYTFRLRPGIRFSDGAPLRPEDVVASFRRLFRVRSPTAETFYGAIDGADECLRSPDTCALPGVAADGDLIRIRLTRQDPEFLTKLALPHASILPASAPQEDAGTVPLPGTGPYAFVSYDPNDRLRLVRNPYFRQWSADAQPDGYPDAIEYEFGLEDEAEVTAIENGQADWMFDTPPIERLGELGARFAPLVHLNPAFALWLAPLNVHLPPFDDARARQAFNLAVDRAATVKLFGGRKLAVPTCQVLPPGLPGYEPYCPYRRDLPRARRLVQQSGTAGQTVTLVTDDSPVARAIGTYLRDVLEDIGYVAKLRTLSANIQFTYIQNTANRVQASLTTWYADYPSAANFLAGIFGCAAFHPDSDSSPNIAGFCDPALDAQVARALATGDLAGLAAVDRAITDAAAAVVLFSPRYIDVVSARVGNYGYHEVFRWLIHRSWVQ
jgi:peptide/nickel transport system substrate-binding protein